MKKSTILFVLGIVFLIIFCFGIAGAFGFIRISKGQWFISFFKSMALFAGALYYQYEYQPVDNYIELVVKKERMATCKNIFYLAVVLQLIILSTFI